MTVYLDTSALVKLYVHEHGSAQVRRVVASERVATSCIAYAEARAALARLLRERMYGAPKHRALVRDLDRDFTAFLVVDASADLARRAGELAERHALRGFDSIHLASALEIGRILSAPPGFLAYDDRLAAAARDEGLAVLP